MTTGERIKYLRLEKLELSQTQLADFLGIAPQTISRWERGLAVPTELSRVKLAHLAEVDPQWILNGN